MTIYADNSYTIGNTPLVRLKHFGNNGNLVVKVESRNPSFSVKCRIGANMVWQAEKDGILTKGKEIVASDPNHYVMLKQFENPANPAIHQQTTGPEIWNATEGKVDVIVAGVGTGGTITGISRHIKQDQGKQIISVAVEPKESPVITQTLNGEEVKPGPHKIQGIGAGFIPKNLDLSLIDRVEQVSSDEAIATARRLMAEEGILVGISSGAAVAAANRLAQQPEFTDKLIVAILPSASERYLSTALFEGIEV